MPTPAAMEPGAAAAPITSDWVPIGFTPDQVRITQGQKDIRTGNAFPPMVGMNHSGVQLMGFADTMSMGYAQVPYRMLAEFTRPLVQQSAPQVKGGGPAYVATLYPASDVPKHQQSLAARLRKALTGNG